MTAAPAVQELNTATTGDGAFAALRFRAYRIYLSGQAFANTGAWMQRIAQDWLVLRLTHSSTAVGITMALQFLPVLLVGVHGGLLADRYPRRRILLITQLTNSLLTAVLALLTLSGAAQAHDVYVFALLTGVVFAIDAPARQVFISEVVPSAQLRRAISLNSAVFQTTRLVGPTVAGILIGTVGTGWVFAANALCYLGPTVGLLRLRPQDLTPAPPANRGSGALRAGMSYVLARPRIFWTIVLVAVVGMFGLNFPIVLTAMADRTFGGDASMYGLFNVVLAVGSAAGALGAGSRTTARLRLILILGALFGAFQALAATAPDLPVFLALLVAMGAANLAFQALANSSIQLTTTPALRGRVMAIYVLVLTGGSTIGSPLIGIITNHFGPRAGMAVCGIVPACAAVLIMVIRTSTAWDACPPTWSRWFRTDVRLRDVRATRVPPN